MLSQNLPWAQQLGTPQRGRQQRATALQRAEHHLATTAADPGSADAIDLLHRRDQLLDRYRALTTDINQSPDTSTDRGRSCDRGLEL